MASIQTRSTTEHSFLGQAAELPERQIPTCGDVYKAYFWLQTQSEQPTKVSDRIKVLAELVKDVYTKASIPTVELHSISVHIKRVIDKVNAMEKYPMSKRSSQSFHDKVSDFNKVFDVCTCKCFDAGMRDRINCMCPLQLKIPPVEWDFWMDQKTHRKLFIGVVDNETTSKLQKRMKRKHRLRFPREGTLLITDAVSTDSLHDSSHDSDGSQEKGDSYAVDVEGDLSSDDECVKGKGQNRLKYPELCKAVERCKVSNRDACIIVNAVLKDMHAFSPKTIIDPSKLRRQRELWRDKAIKDHEITCSKFTCIGFDGKKDSTLVETSGCK